MGVVIVAFAGFACVVLLSVSEKISLGMMSKRRQSFFIYRS